jgi:NAD(P)-dependent dehydrogenase (short-subunit alcohol dehydrogenase family)
MSDAVADPRRAVVVTGSAGGIGTALCERFAADGYYVVGIDLGRSSAADESVQVDSSDLVALELAATEIAARHDVRVLVHCAAHQPLARAGETSVPEWLTTLSVNVVAADLLLGVFLDSLESVVAVSSVHGRATTSGIAAYATSKAALEGWARAAALDHAPRIRVNAVVPGAVDTAKLREGFARWGEQVGAERRAVLEERTPAGRVGAATEIADAVAFLAGPHAGFITGTSLVVDGGATVRLGSE